MIQKYSVIEITKGGEVVTLYTPSLFQVAKEREIEIKLGTDQESVFSAYLLIMYLAALNAWEVERIDNPRIKPFPYTFKDFILWRSGNPEAFAKEFETAVLALTGKSVQELIREATASPQEEKKKKTPFFWWITQKLKRS